MATPYIPRVSSQIFAGQLMPEIREAEGGLYEGARGLESAQSKRGVTGAIGAMGGRAVGKVVQKYLLASGHPLLAFLAPHIGAGIGTYLGTKAAGRGPKIENPTSLYGSEYDVLRDIRKRMPEAAKGAAWGRFGSSLGWDLLSGGMKSEAGKELFGDLFKQSEDPYSDIKEMADEAFGPERSELSQSVFRFRDKLKSSLDEQYMQDILSRSSNKSNAGYIDIDSAKLPYFDQGIDVPDIKTDTPTDNWLGGFQQGGLIPEYAGGGPVGGLIQYRKGY